MTKRRDMAAAGKRMRRFGLAAAALAATLAAGGVKAGELPDAIGTVALGRDPQPGMWMEYVLLLPVDPLEEELLAAAARRFSAVARSDAAAATTASARLRLIPPMADLAADDPGNADAAKPATGNLAPPSGLVGRREPFPVRLTLRSVTPLTAEVAVQTPGAPVRIATVPRVSPVADAAREAAIDAPRMESGPGATDSVVPPAPGSSAGAEPEDMARPDHTAPGELSLYDGRTLPVAINRYGAGEAAVEVWTAPEVPFGVAALKTRDLDMTLRGYGYGTEEPPPFPLPRTVAAKP